MKLVRVNSSWGYDRIIGAMATLGHVISGQARSGARPRACHQQNAEPQSAQHDGHGNNRWPLFDTKLQLGLHPEELIVARLLMQLLQPGR